MIGRIEKIPIVSIKTYNSLLDMVSKFNAKKSFRI